MTRARLEQEFTSMLVRTNTHRAYWNLARNYFTTNSNYELLTCGEWEAKLKKLRENEPKEWIMKIFSEGLQIPSKLYQVNTLWLKHLEEVTWE